MNLLITGAWRPEAQTVSQICAMGYEIYFMPDEAGELPCEPSSVHAVICNGLFIYHPLSLFTNLQFIQLTSAGFDRVPMAQAMERGIKVFNARGVYDTPMAEFALAGVLQLFKQSRFFSANQEKRIWCKHRGLLELEAKTVCIVGCGSVGQCCAKKFSALDCRIIGVDAYPRENPYFEAIYPVESLHQVLQNADILILSVPLLPETEKLMDSTTFENMKQGAVLVNISRGAVVDTSALISALESKLAGAVLDVFELEPLPQDSPLWGFEHVILSPHNSFVGEGNSFRLRTLILENLQSVTV